jgi:hypothetical protein
VGGAVQGCRRDRTIDHRKAQPGNLLVNFDDRWVTAAREVIDEQTPESKVAKSIIIARVNARADRTTGQVSSPPLLEAPHTRSSTSSPVAARPSREHQTQALQREPAARPYGRLHATAPGQYVLLDTTPLNVFAVAPVTGKWVAADLTVAIDLYSRCILGMRLTPGSTKSIDVSGVLMEACQPFDTPAEWGTSARWPFHGVAGSVLVDPTRIRVRGSSVRGSCPTRSSSTTAHHTSRST